MAKQRYLSKAPIIEAIVDIKVKLPLDVDATKLRTIHDLISEQYPKELEFTTGTFGMKKGKAPEVTHKGIFGYRYTSNNGKQVVQANFEGFVFSRLKPYMEWESFCKEAHRLWLLYADFLSPELITRVALRYINRLGIPYSCKSLGEYLVTPPMIPEKLPQGLSSFLNRIVIHEPVLQATAIIMQTLEPVIGQEAAPVVLDIDVFKEGQFNVDGKDAWGIIGNLHDLKNKIFFESITEKTVELYL